MAQPTDAAPVGTPVRAIGENLQRLRLGQGLSYAALARKAGIGKSTIFNLERGQGNPAIDTLWALARALGTPLGALFVDNALSGVHVLRRRDAPTLVDNMLRPPKAGASRARHVEPASNTFLARHLVATRNSRQCELYWVEMDPGSSHESAGHSAGIVEHVVPLLGTVKIRLADNDAVTLAPGDRMTFPASLSHSFHTEKKAATLLSLLEYP